MDMCTYNYSMKRYPSVFHACASKLRPVIGFFEPTNLDEVSNRTPGLR